MHFFTWCNKINHPKLKILEKSAEHNGIKVEVLGKGIKWERNYQKIGLLYEALRNVPKDEVIVCSDAFDVLYLINSDEILRKFQEILSDNDTPEDRDPKQLEDTPIIFGCEKLYTHHYPKYRKYWDSLEAPHEYRYLNGGTFIGYCASLFKIMGEILQKSKKYTEKSDQKLYGKYGAKHPGKILLDYNCKLFWCPAGEQQILSKLYDIFTKENGIQALKNLKTGEDPCLIHITYSRGYHHLLLEVAQKMGYITEEEKEKYLKLHKKELKLRQKKKREQRKIKRNSKR